MGVSHKVLSDHHRSFQFFSWQLNPKKFLFGTSIFLKYNTYIQSKETGLYIHLVGLRIVGLKVCLNVKIDVKTTQVRQIYDLHTEIYFWRGKTLSGFRYHKFHSGLKL